MKSDYSRRGFLRDAAVMGAAATVGAATVSVAAPEVARAAGEQRKVLHIIGYSHIDAAWLWPWRDGADTVLTTFRSALNRMEETPGFCYSHSSSAHYRWVEQADPGMLTEIKKRIAEGRWEVVGGWPVEPDCNIPATESFVRHSLYGKRYCQQTLGADVKIGFNPDSFGHAAGLPTILKGAGYGYYVFMRPQEHEMKLPLVFWWEGPDGSRVLVCRIWRGYDVGADRVRPTAGHGFAEGLKDGALFLGVGDHGGAVTKEQIREVLAMQKDSSLPELRFSTMSGFFKAVEGSAGFAQLPVIRGELQHHSRGCYSAYGEGKYQNRRAERWLTQTEAITLVAGTETSFAGPSPKNFGEAWWKVLFCQFHDMMAGTSLYSDYQDVRDSIGSACEMAQAAKVTALEAMARRVDTSAVEESALFLFNPLPWKRKALVECYAEHNPSGNAPITHLKAKDGRRIPLQWRPSESMTPFFRRISAWVDLPPCGYSVLELAHGEEPDGEAYSERVRVSETGFGIASLKAEDGVELLSAPVGLVAISDPNDTWAHDVRAFRAEIGRPQFESGVVIEDGPVTRVTRHRARWRSSEIVLDMAQFAGMDVVELRFTIDWHEKEQMLKLEIPTALKDTKFFAKVPGAVLERKTNGEEEPYQDWGAVQGKIGGKEYTVALLNGQTYSYDCLDGLFRTVLIRSAPFARHNPAQVPHDDAFAWQDQGRQERRFWLVGASGAWSGMALDRKAEEMQTPAESVMDSAHAGSEPWERSFLEVTPENVWVLAMKHAEDAPNEVIVRVQERAGKKTTASVKAGVWGLEERVELAPWEIKTLRITPGKSGRVGVKVVSLMET